MKKIGSLILAIVTAGMLALTGCSAKPAADMSKVQPQPGSENGSTSEEKDTLIVATNAGPVDLDPHGTTDQNTYDVRYQVYEALVRAGVNGEILPGLASEWEWEDDTTLNLKLREGVKFHNGSEFNGEDVIFSLNRALESTFTSSYLEHVLPDESKVLEDGRVQVKLEVPVSAFLSRLSMVMMIDKETWDETVSVNEPVGTGAYQFVKWYEGDRIEFQSFPNYWEGEPYFKHLTMRFIAESAARALEMEAGTVDVTLAVQASDLATLRADENIELYSTPCYMLTYLGFDTTQAPYDNKLVRQALNYAIDREAISSIVYESLGQPALYGRLSPVYWGYTEEGLTRYDYNPIKARELLAQAGYPNGFDMKLTLSESEQDQVDMSEIIQNQLGEIGVNVTIDIMENASFLNLIVDGGFDAFLLNTTGSSADPGEALKSFISSRPTWSNTTRFRNEELTSLIEEGQQTINEDKKLEIFHKAQQMVTDECPWVFLIHNEVTFAAKKEIQGMVAYPSTAHFFKEAVLAP